MEILFPELLELKGAETREGIGHKDTSPIPTRS